MFFVMCSISVIVTALPAPATGGRLLLLLKCLSDGMETSSSKRAKKNSSYEIGSLIQAEVRIISISSLGNHSFGCILFSTLK